MDANRRLGLLAKWPRPGRVKTRLCPPLTATEATRLYTAFVADLMRNLEAVPAARVLFLDHHAGDPASQLDWPAWPVEFQRGADLGERLRNAWARLAGMAGGAMSGRGGAGGGGGSEGAAGGANRQAWPAVVLLGADHPSLPADRVEAAFALLERAELVLGPTTDGGYYLIGLRAVAPEIFAGMPWSRPELLARTLDRAAALGLRVAACEPWYDVDDPPALALLRQHLRLQALAGHHPCPRTRAVLEALLQGTEAGPA